MRKFLIVGLAMFVTSGAALADAGLSEAGSRDLGGAVGRSVGNGAAIVGMSAAVPMMSVGKVGEAMAVSAGGQLSKSRYQVGKPLPMGKQVVVPALSPDQALARQTAEN
jgi:hypothetical protein